ncbi:MAG: hypothetical protein JWO30_3374 [Fibrobacteres bacterium]|nr:hypothetical protein [Fibrobacterota bacterium]
MCMSKAKANNLNELSGCSRIEFASYASRKRFPFFRKPHAGDHQPLSLRAKALGLVRRLIGHYTDLENIRK